VLQRKSVARREEKRSVSGRFGQPSRKRFKANQQKTMRLMPIEYQVSTSLAG
jgi:hypothetical protein